MDQARNIAAAAVARPKQSALPIRILTAVPICDGHDSAISTINLEFIRNGIEVIYLGFHRSARDIARAAVQEDVRAVGISSYNGGHVEFFAAVGKLLKEYGAGDIGLFGGGGGTITREDARAMQKHGVSRIFFAGTPLGEMVEFVQETWGGAPPTKAAGDSHVDHQLGRLLTSVTLAPVLGGEGRGEGSAGELRGSLNGPSPQPSPLSTGARDSRGHRHERAKRGVTSKFIPPTPVLRYSEEPDTSTVVRDSRNSTDPALAENARLGKPLPGTRPRESNPQLSARRPRLVIGVCGPGGAGKTTLIDELVLRFLRPDERTRLAVLSHDPSIVGSGALLGDRAAMLYSQDDRVFMRSLASGGRAGGLAAASERCLQVLRNDPIGGGFDVILVETVGIGQEAVPFAEGLVDKTVFVMSPEYGSRLQLQKIAMLDLADIVVINKADMAAASAAAAEVQQRLEMNHRGQQIVSTVAKRHRDTGVDALFELLNGLVLSSGPR